MSKTLRTLLFSITLIISLPVVEAAESYGETVAFKAGSGFSNMALGWLEIPKNVIATSNQVNLIVGFTGGVLKGVVHTVGRTLTGVVDLVSAPLPTKPIVEPPLVWENFNLETQYNPVFKLKD